MQYWKPEDAHEFVGDMMPYWDGERFHLFYLLDRDHHAECGGLGGHQWAHASTTDLVTWQHHPLAVPRGVPGTCDENGICTGSIFEHAGIYYAFYATRLRREDGSVQEAVCRAEGRDLVRFDKSPENPLFAAPPGLDPRNHRDPFVFQHPETGAFHMLVTATRAADIPGDGPERGVLAHYTSPNLAQWEYHGPFLGLDADPAPECPEHFFWNGWWYLLYSQGQQMRCWVSHGPLGPWERRGRGTIEGPNLVVPRTAAFTGGRRLAVGFLSWREEEQDSTGYVYAGSTLFRELFQDEDGTLTAGLVPEMMPRTGPPQTWTVHGDPGVQATDGGLSLVAGNGVASARIPGVPADGVLSLRLACAPGVGEYSLLLRAGEDLKTGYCLSFSPRARRVALRRAPEEDSRLRAEVADLEGLETGVDIVVCMQGSSIDVCLNGRHCLAERCFDFRGTTLGLLARAGEVRVEDLSIRPLLPV